MGVNEDLITAIAMRCNGGPWTEERRTALIQELTQAAAMQSNRGSDFTEGLRFLSQQQLGYGRATSGTHNQAVWRFSPNGTGPSIVKREDDDFVELKVREISGYRPGVRTICQVKTFGMDVEFEVGRNGHRGASGFFRGWAPGSGIDGSGELTWEHRTPPTVYAAEQYWNLVLLQNHLEKYLAGKYEDNGRTPLRLCRTDRPVGSHLHIHTHAGITRPSLSQYLLVLTAVWNCHPTNQDATLCRWRAGYGTACDAVRDPAWHAPCQRAVSMEFRGFTSPDFGSRGSVERFAAVLACVDWLLAHPRGLAPITIEYPDRELPGRDYIAMAKTIFATPHMEEVLS